MKLKNFTKRLFVVTLPHDEVCAEQCYCTNTQHLQSVHNPKTGDVGIRQVDMRVPVSLHVLVKAETEELPEAFLNAQAIKSALANGYLRKVE